MGSGTNEAGSGLDSIPPAPVFYPTEEEWSDPFNYVRRIQRQASRYGICKVVPPGSWNPPKTGSPVVRFRTKQQNIHQLFRRRGLYERFMTFLRQFHRAQGDWATCRAQVPRIKGRIVDLMLLYRAVIGHGGYEQVNRSGLWRRIATVELRMIWTTSISANTKALYHRWLLPLEHHERKRRGMRAMQRDPLELEFTKFACDTECAQCLVEHIRENDTLSTGNGQKRMGNSYAPAGATTVCTEAGFPSNAEPCSTESKLWRCMQCGDSWHPNCYAQAMSDYGTSATAPSRMEINPTMFVCPQCDDDHRFGYTEGTVFSYKEYVRFARDFKAAWFRIGSSASMNDCKTQGPTAEEIEGEYWRLVDTAEERCEVLYGSELDVNIVGSGFPRLGSVTTEKMNADQLALWEQYAMHPWNLNMLPLLGSSLLRVLSARYSGITDPWLYAGMVFATFCYHAEDSDMYSINYMHSGEGKVWYGCPGGDGCRQFENAMRDTVPELFAAMPDLLYNMITMVNPAVLREKGAPMCRTVQRPGEFVLTFPQAYHGGFSLGVNIAEAVNFALTDWLPYGRQAMVRYREMRREAPFAQEEIIFSALERRDVWSTMAPAELERLCQELRYLIQEELALREAAGCFGGVPERLADPRAPTYVSHQGGSDRDTCPSCRQPFFLSAVRCACMPERRTCVRHAFATCACPAAAKTLLYLYSDAELRRLLSDPSQAVLLAEHRKTNGETGANRKRVHSASRADLDTRERIAKQAAGGSPPKAVSLANGVDGAPSVACKRMLGKYSGENGVESSIRPEINQACSGNDGNRALEATPSGVQSEWCTSNATKCSRTKMHTELLAKTSQVEQPCLVKFIPAADGQAPSILLFRVPSE
jgi:histone demethylase JARID1